MSASLEAQLAEARAELARARESEAAYKFLFDSIDEGFCVIEVLFDEAGGPFDYRFLSVNAAFAQQTGLEDAVGRTIREMAPGHESHWFELFGRIADTGTPERFEDRADALGRWFEVYAFRVGDRGQRQVAVLFKDVLARRRVEDALRDSEGRFRQFARASSDGLWIRDSQTLTLEFVSPAMETIYGVGADALKRDLTVWLDLIVSEDRDEALAYLEQVRRGEPVAHEFRIQRPGDHGVRWIRSTGFPLFDARGGVQRLAGIASDITEARQAIQHQAILLAELQHRVRNTMAMIRSITARTADSARSVDDYAALMAGRLLALSRTQTLLTRAPNAGVEIGRLVREELAAQAHDASQYVLDGPTLMISPKAAEVLSLAIHELATNALKYGALADPDGQVSVTWMVMQPNETPSLRLDWTETRPTPPDWIPPTRRGFGSELIEQRVPYELGGRGGLEIAAQGARAWIEIPLRPGASILETEGPTRGGA